ncbi:response regulator [Sulfurovum sp.]|uniref:response regulator n=1 Tax=Sulfurovum sp. TaxID=1969726 RepID=UPI002F921AEF
MAERERHLSKKPKEFLEIGKTLKVLYVEDSEIVRESTSDILYQYFDTFDIAINGEEGFQKYKQFHEAHHTFYDIVITDINMPKMNGIEMIELILAMDQEANIIIMSAHNESDYLLQLINLGVSNFVLKPVNMTLFQTILLRTIETVIKQKQLKHYHKKMEEINLTLRKAKEDAENASIQKSQFLANMSHEIRTPLNAITGFISLLNKKETDPEKLKYLQIIKNSSDSLLHIISDILDISKIENNMLDIEPVNFDPYEELIAVAELFQVKAAEKGIVLSVHFNAKMPKNLYSDVLRIKQIFYNLLSNAIKFTPEGSKIKSIICYSKGTLNVRVKDYGIGIPEEKHESIFNSFYQIEGTTNRYGGTGLGLSISRQLARMLGGELTLQSREGKGSTFKLSIAMQKGEKAQKTLQSLYEAQDPFHGHVLLVEDYEANRMFIGIILDNAGITYETANNGIEAIEKFKKGTYDLILMDENMPELGGIGATKAIRAVEKETGQKHTPIISLTANALKGDRERFLQAGMDDYISKPVEPDNLLIIIRKYITPDLETS